MSRRRKRYTPPFDVEIQALDASGLGLGEHEGSPVVVRCAPPGAVLHVMPFRRKKGVLHARRLHTVTPPPDGVTPPCAVFGLCGGCTLQELPLARQRALKHDAAIGILGDTTAVPVHPIRGAEAAYGYRNKMEFSFGNSRYLSEAAHAEGQPIAGSWIGMHAPGRFDRVVDTEHCPLMPQGLNDVLAVVRAHLAASERPCWDARAHTGYWRHLLLRETRLGERLVAVFTGTDDGADEIQALADALPDVHGVLWFVNPDRADVARGTLQGVLRGRPWIEERLGPITYRLSATAFFQTNTAAAEVLYDTIAEALKLDRTPGKRLLDLYCGTGAIGLYLADRYDSVLGIELNPASVEDARANAARSGVANATYVAGAVEDHLPDLLPGDVAVVDPPRAGLHPKVASFLADCALTELVYVACKAASLARDRQILEAGGWVLQELWTVDLFPQTGHIEVVARFTRP